MSPGGAISENLGPHGHELDTGEASDSSSKASSEDQRSQVIENRMMSHKEAAINPLEDTDTSGNGTDYDDGIPEESDDAASVAPVEPIALRVIAFGRKES